MSADNTDPVAAYNMLVDQIYRPVLLSKMASAGYPANTQEEEAHLLQLAAQIRQARLASANGVDRSRVNILKAASEDLGAVTGADRNMQALRKQAAAETEMTKIAEISRAIVQKNPVLRDASLIYQQAMIDLVQGSR